MESGRFPPQGVECATWMKPPSIEAGRPEGLGHGPEERGRGWIQLNGVGACVFLRGRNHGGKSLSVRNGPRRFCTRAAPSPDPSAPPVKREAKPTAWTAG